MTEHLPNQARNYAQEKHHRQTRKGKQVPYFDHVAQVARTLTNYGFSEEVIAAAYLHDTTEDLDNLTIQDIECEFNQEVAQLVDGSSEHDKSASWKERKQHTLNHLQEEATQQEIAIKIADKIDNVRSINQELAQHGNQLWDKFNATYPEQKWYHTELLKITQKRINNSENKTDGELQNLLQELQTEINHAFNKE